MYLNISQALELEEPIEFYVISTMLSENVGEDTLKFLARTYEDGERYYFTNTLNDEMLKFSSEEDIQLFFEKNKFKYIANHFPKESKKLEITLISLNVSMNSISNINIEQEKIKSSIISKLSKEELEFLKNNGLN